MKTWKLLAVAVSAGLALALFAACSKQPEEATPAPAARAVLGQISGTVTDGAGAPQQGLRVMIVSGTAAFPEIAPVTDERGSYRIGPLEPGTFQVSVRDARGNSIAQESVVVGGDQTAELDFVVSLLDFETCAGFLAEPPPNLVSKTRELTATAKQDNPSIETMCQASHETLDGSRAMTLAVINFDSTDAADSHLETILNDLRASPIAEITDGVVGTRSFQADLNSSGVGSMVVFQDASRVISLHTTMPEGEPPLREATLLVGLARDIRERLP